jgi:hypothetical protein
MEMNILGEGFLSFNVFDLLNCNICQLHTTLYSNLAKICFKLDFRKT